MCIFVNMIFLTGGTGLVGSHILLMLCRENISVRALKRKKSTLNICKKVFKYYNTSHLFNKIDWCDGDINNVPLLEKYMASCDMVIHAAALVSFYRYDINNLKKTNIEGTANIMNVALELNIKKCIYISSVATLGRDLVNHKVDEDCIFKMSNKESNYAISKYFAEQEVWRASNEGLDVVILNPSIILGPGDWNKGSSKIFQKIYNGLKFYTTGSTGYIDVIDIANIVLLFLRNDIKNQRFILNGTNMNYRDAFNLIADEFGVKRATIKVTPFLKEIAWRFENFKSFFTNRPALLTKETAESSMRNSQYSTAKIKRILNYEFISFEESIKKYCLFFKQDLL
jgi:dihydroflavonol-4-reductase